MTNQNGKTNGTAAAGRYRKAEKAGIFARVAICGPSGAGKSYTALRIARGLAGDDGKIFVLDTERGRILRYADRFDFFVADLSNYSTDDFIKAIDDAVAEGAAVLIIDSGSHAWISSGSGGILDEVDRLTSSDRATNNFNVWAKMTPEWSKLINKIVGVRCHTITTMRAKTKWVVESYENGRGQLKHKPVKVGTKPEFRDGSEYEFDIWGDIDIQHNMTLSKTSEGLPSGVIELPDESLGQTIKAWTESSKAEAWRHVADAIAAREIELQGSLDRDLVAIWFEEKFDGRPKSKFTLDEVRFLAATIGDYIFAGAKPGELTIRESLTAPFDPDPDSGVNSPQPENGEREAQTPQPSPSDSPGEPEDPAPTFGAPTRPQEAGAPAPQAQPSPVDQKADSVEQAAENEPAGTEVPMSPAVLSRIAEVEAREAEIREEELRTQRNGESMTERFERIGRELYGPNFKNTTPDEPPRGPDGSQELFENSTAEAVGASWPNH